MPAYLIIGASRGIGLELTSQLLARNDPSTFVYATARNPGSASLLAAVMERYSGRCAVLECDLAEEASCKALLTSLDSLAKQKKGGVLELDYCIFNAGVLEYPSPASDMTFSSFSHHLTTNTIGPIVLASLLLSTPSLSLSNLTFISSDSGSSTNFLSHELGFAAYAASKAALNMAVRHLDAELRHRQKQSLAHQTSTSSGRGEKEEILPSSRRPISVFALHPGEVATDMASNVNVPWTVEGVLSVRESVEGCLRTIEARRVEESGTVWTWEGKEYPW